MKALRLLAWQQAPELVDVEVPEPGPGQVLVRIGGAGACHSDLHVMDMPPGQMAYELPFTLGHENAGWIERVGAGVWGFAAGDAVAVYGPWSCGRCQACLQGLWNSCDHLAEQRIRAFGLGTDGGMADFMLVPDARQLVPLRDLTPAAAAPLTDAGLTPYHAIQRSLPILVPGSTAVVIGAGGLGHLAVQILRVLTPARVIAVDRSPEQLEMARSLGAEHAVEAGPAAVATIRELTCGLGAEVVLDFVGVADTLDLAARVARQRGHVTVVGLTSATIPFGYGTVPIECSFLVSRWGSLPELHEVIALAESGKISAHVVTVPLEGAAEAYAALRAGKVRGRIVVVPGAGAA